jgi:hypothetical protein
VSGCPGNGLKHTLSDALKSTLAVFYFQHPSPLNFQREMRRKTKRNNLETLFEASETPRTEQIKNIVDDIEPGSLLKRNFGHGKNHASELFCLLNVLSYLIHGIQDVANEERRKARGSFGRRDAFFRALRYEMSRYLHDDWSDFLLAIADESIDDS